MDEIEILKVKIEDSTATVKAKMTVTAKNPFTGEKETKTSEGNIPLVLEEGEWKITEKL